MPFGRYEGTKDGKNLADHYVAGDNGQVSDQSAAIQ